MFLSMQLTDNLEGVNVHVGSDMFITTTSKRSVNSWMFTVTSKVIITARNEVGARLYFHRRLWFYPRGGVPGQVHPPGPGTPPQDQVPPGTRYTPPDQVHPPPPGPGTPPGLPGDTGNKRAVRILLECILVITCGRFTKSGNRVATSTVNWIDSHF